MNLYIDPITYVISFSIAIGFFVLTKVYRKFKLELVKHEV